MSDQPKPLYALCEEWRKMTQPPYHGGTSNQMLELCAKRLEAALKAWDAELPDDNFDPTRWPDHIRKAILGLPKGTGE